MKMRWEILNYLINVNKYNSYLEIGLAGGTNFRKIKCDNKTSVDPARGKREHSQPDYVMTSDEFFQKNESMFDIIFIDGLHHANQVYKDIMNSLECLNPTGTIVCHDMNPDNELSQQVPSKTKIWYGDCWKAFVRLRTERDDLSMYVIDTDCGLGVIRPGVQDKLSINSEFYQDYNNFVDNKEEWLNLITIEQFKSEK